MKRTPKALLFALSIAGMALADAGQQAGPDFQPLDKAKAMARETFKGIAVYSTTPPGGGG